MPNFASLSCFYSKLRRGAFLPPPLSKIGCPNTPFKIGLKLDYEKFGVSNFFFQKLSKKTFGSARPPPSGTGRVKQ